MNPKTIVVVCIHDRYENLKMWLHSWNLCDTNNAKLFIVHNTDSHETRYWQRYCQKRGANYVKRENVGYETGVIQDVIMERMFAEENWEYFLFATDDTLPMKRDFIRRYINKMEPDVGVACMQISGVYTPHIRTTGFCIDKETAIEIEFDEQVVTKKQCYNFEHQGGEGTLMSQILRLDKMVVQVSNIWESPLWDTHHTLLDRWEEWHREFPAYKPE